MECFALTLVDFWQSPGGFQQVPMLQQAKQWSKRATPSFTDPPPGQEPEQRMTLKTCGKTPNDPQINPVRLAVAVIIGIWKGTETEVNHHRSNVSLQMIQATVYSCMLPTLITLQCLAPESEQRAWVGITSHSEVCRGAPGSLGAHILVSAPVSPCLQEQGPH